MSSAGVVESGETATTPLMGVLGRDGRFVVVGPAWSAQLGWSEVELRALGWLELLHAEDRALGAAGLERIAGGAASAVFEARARLRPEGHGLLSWQLVSGGADGLVCCVATRRPAPDALAVEPDGAAVRRLEVMLKQMRDVVVILRADGTLLDVNEAGPRAYGYTREEMIGMHIRELRVADESPRIAQHVAEAFAGGTRFETRHRRKDGTVFPCEVVGRRCELADGEIAAVGVIRDTTERRLLQDRLVHADRLAVLGMLAASIAHEVNSPLAYVMANLDLVLARLGPPEGATLPAGVTTEIREMLAAARHGAGRVRSIVRGLKSFARPDGQARGPVDVRAAIDGAIELTGNEVRQRATLVREYGDAPLVDADEARLGQVFVNLLVNAAHALPDGTRDRNEIRVRVRAEGGEAVVHVDDNGGGIDPALLPMIFDPFVSSKPAELGTGLGLFIAREIVSEVGGEITVRSEVGVGTCFTVRLPAARAHAAPPAVAAASRPAGAVRRRARVLVVDDEVGIINVLRRALAPTADLIVATGGQAALAVLAEDHRFDVVLCDLMMPDVTGMAVFESVRASRPELATRFVFMTGGASSDAARQFFATMSNPCLEKPFEVSALLGLIRERVEAAGPEDVERSKP